MGDESKAGLKKFPFLGILPSLFQGKSGDAKNANQYSNCALLAKLSVCHCFYILAKLLLLFTKYQSVEAKKCSSSRYAR